MSRRQRPNYEYRGFRYVVEEDREEDNIKFFHYAVAGKEEGIDIPGGSPYGYFSEDDFKRFVDSLIARNAWFLEELRSLK